jgi:hypothetical protein
MPTPVQLFHRICRDEGIGIPFKPAIEQLDIFANQQAIVAAWIEDVRLRVIAGKFLPTINFQYFTSGTFNGIASIIGPEAFIGLARGSVLLPYDLFHRIMAHPSLLPEIGDPSGESVNSQHEEGICNDFGDVVSKRAGQQIPTQRAKNATREAFADICAKIAFDFLITHEIAHITHGHLNFRSTGNAPFITEFAMAHNLSPSQALSIQALEMDADASGATMSLSQINRIQALSMESHGLPNSLEGACFLWGCAITGLFHLWGIDIGINDFTKPHPPIGIRYALVRSTAAGLLSRIIPSRSAIAIDAIVEGSYAISHAIAALGGPSLHETQSAILAPFDDPVMRLHQEAIMSEWDNIRDRVFVSAIVPIAPKRPPGTTLFSPS